jgi:hypothetical protein
MAQIYTRSMSMGFYFYLSNNACIWARGQRKSDLVIEVVIFNTQSTNRLPASTIQFSTDEEQVHKITSNKHTCWCWFPFKNATNFPKLSAGVWAQQTTGKMFLLDSRIFSAARWPQILGGRGSVPSLNYKSEPSWTLDRNTTMASGSDL